MPDDDFLTRLHILRDILAEKREALSRFMNICDNQELVLESAGGESRSEILREMANAKQDLIDRVLDADKAFQISFDGISAGFEENAPKFREDVLELQTLISEVLELDTKIRAFEQNRKTLISRGNKDDINISGVRKDYVFGQYAEQGKKRERGRRLE